MVKLFASLCEKGERNFLSVPKSLQSKVKEAIEADGFMILDDGTVVPALSEVA